MEIRNVQQHEIPAHARPAGRHGLRHRGVRSPLASAAQISESHCVPGMTAATPGGCSLPGFHWAYTTQSTGHNSYDRSVWMLLPNG
jgi:hypothetical protein